MMYSTPYTVTLVAGFWSRLISLLRAYTTPIGAIVSWFFIHSAETPIRCLY
jgi:hypothetical protein